MAQIPDIDVTTISVGGSAYTVPFAYQNRAEVFVEVDGVSTTFTWINDGNISITPAPAAGAVVRRYRNTSALKIRHDYRNGVPFTPRNIAENNDQLLFVVQESVNDTAGTAALALATSEQALDTAQDALDFVGERTQYMVLGPYGPGLKFQTTSQVFSYGGEFYAPGAAIVLPYTTTGIGAAEVANFRSVGDALLRSDLADSATHGKGASLIGYKAGTVADSLTLLGDDAQVNAALFRRELVLDLPFRDSYYDSLIAAYSYDFLYPQAFAVDTIAREVFILKAASSGANAWAWIWVHDLDTGATKTRFTTGQQWRESLVLRREGASRFLYTIGNGTSVIKLDVSTLPANLATLSPVATFPVSGQSFLAHDGENWIVQDNISSSGKSRRNRFKIYDAAFARKIGELNLPLDAVGTLDATYTKYFPKAQGICFYNGALYAACGGDYNTASPASVAMRYDPIKLQGVQAFSTSGVQIASALGDPEISRQAMKAMVGRHCAVIETEGLSADGGELYSIWQTLSPAAWAGSSGLSHGIVIAKELSKSSARTDFSGAARVVKSALNLTQFSVRIHHSPSAQVNPVTGEVLDSFQKIIDMMVALDLPRYSYNGTNNTLADVNGADVPIVGAVVDFENINGFTFVVTVRGGTDTREGTVRYIVTGAGSAQLGPYHEGAEVGTNAAGTYIKHVSGILECFTPVVASATCTTAAGSLFRSAGDVWTYPMPFLSGSVPVVSVSGNWGTRFAGGTSGTPGSSSCTVFVHSVSSDATARPISARAIGRWK